MRRLFCLVTAGLVLSAEGCGQAPRVTAGGKPVSHWVQALQDPAAGVRKKAAQKLGNVGATDPVVVPALAGALKDRDAAVRAEAALALLRIGPAAREAAPSLTELQKDRDARVRAYAVQALAKLQGAK